MAATPLEWPSACPESLPIHAPVLHSPVPLLPSPEQSAKHGAPAATGQSDSWPESGGTPPALKDTVLGDPNVPRQRVATGGTAAPSTEEERRKRKLEKNKRAQLRYRQKKKAEAETAAVDVEAADAEMQRLRLENERLAANNEVLGAVLEVREDAVAKLEEGKNPDTAAGSTGRLTLSVAMERLNLRGTPLPESPRAAAAAAAAIEVVAPCPISGLSLSEVAAVKATGPKAVAANFKAVVDPLRDALGRLEAPGAAPAEHAAAEHEMLQVLYEAGCMCFEHSLHNPTGLQCLMAATVDCDAGGPPEEVEAAARRFAGVAAAMELAPGQCTAMQPLRELFQQRMARLMAERRELLAGLQASAAPTAALQALRTATAQWLDMHEATAELDANLQEEYRVCMQFVATAFGAVLSPVQKAKALVLSHPQFPDMLLIANAAREGMGKVGEGHA